ncbi:major facilitator superfamily domain-containing protein [Aspergillus spectabilis]
MSASENISVLPDDKTITAVQTTPDIDNVEKNSRAAFLSQFTAEYDRRIMRKVDRRVLLLMGLMYLLKQIDYTNAASVKVLQVGLVLFEVPSNLMLKRVTPHKWMTRIFFTWGIVVACHAAIQNKAGFYALRFLLGALEAGFFPGLAAQMWNTDAPSCGCGLSAWRWVFLLEGLVAILFCPAIYFILPDYPKSPSSSKWLTPDEQEYLELRLSENAYSADDPNFSIPEIKIYFFTACQFLLNIAGYGLSWQLPTITTSLGFAGLPRNQLLNIPPAAATVIGIIIAARIMRWAVITRPLFCQALNGITLIFFIVLRCPVSPGATYAALVLGTTFYFVYFIPFWGWRSSSLIGATGTAFAVALQTAVAQVGRIIAPQVFQSKYASDDYRISFIICTACTASTAAAMVSNQILWWLSKDVEDDVLNVRGKRIEAEKAEVVWVGEDVKVIKR